ncbi:hypothetical protein Cme02nite_71010 [Catellatospora methionotrophica]|uniref:Uncharacterized protein n=1 Tax=Catellatospora methionotrophica TaxID=121620 RepID=A0A8J3PJG6_9ACTN|nr:hypothetical protein [Catellatospora methionotrophica]GIG18769.1 hypothetical protein Cme02nite_71010 [Catellatospora methionotrophica]
MSNSIYHDEYGTISRDDGDVLALTWSAATDHISDDAFRALMSRFAQTAEQEPTRYAVVDARELRHRPDADFDDWYDQHVVPSLDRAGLAKLAYLMRPAEAAEAEPAPEGPATFPTAYFDSMESVRDWLTSG